MLPRRILALVLVLCPAWLFGTVHETFFNQRARLNVSSGDTLRLNGFPSWSYNELQAVVDGSSDSIFLVLDCQGRELSLSGWSTIFSCAYADDDPLDLKVISGNGSIDFTWWVAQIGSSSSSDVSSSSWSGASSSSDYTPVVHELNPMGEPMNMTGSGGLYKITDYPDWDFNVIIVQVSSYDGQELEGSLNTCSGKIPLTGWVKQVMFKEQGTSAMGFEIALPEQRQMGISWWTENRVPDSLGVSATITDTGDSLTVLYDFKAHHLVSENLTLHYVQSDFVDGQPPRIVRLQHNPQGVRYPDRVEDEQGPTYSITANPVAGAHVSLALPVPQAAVFNGIVLDSLSLMHYDESSRTWSEVIADSVSNGFLYFSSSCFSKWYIRWPRKAKNVIVDGVGELGNLLADALVYVGGLVDEVKDGLVNVYHDLTNGICSSLDPDTYVDWAQDMFGDEGFFSLDWVVPQADLSELVRSPYFDAAKLQAYLDAHPLQPLQSTGDPVKDEIENWKISRANVQVLLTDVLLARHHASYSRRYEVDLGGVYSSHTSFSYASAFNLSGTATLSNGGSSDTLGTYFLSSSTFLAAIPHVLDLLRECDGVLGLADEFTHTFNDCKDLAQIFSGNLSGACKAAFGLVGDAVDWVFPDVATCALETASFKTYYNSKNLDGYVIHKDDFINYSGEYLNALTTLLWVDDVYKSALGGMARALRHQIHGYVGFSHDFYGNNNIPIKALSGVAFYDLLFRGDKTAYHTMKNWLEAKSGDAGGYAEGTYYLHYLNVDVPYLLAAMVRAKLIERHELPQKYLKSGEWLRQQVRLLPGGLIYPVEVDDGGSAQPDFFVYAYLNSNPSQASFAAQYANPLHEPLQFLGLPMASTAAVPPLPNLFYADGVGVVRQSTDSSVLTLSIVAENGAMWNEGVGHDQQDNTSVTLTSSVQGHLVRDPGYSGFRLRNGNLYPRFNNHNVCMIPEANSFGGEGVNGKMTYGDVVDALKRISGVHNLDWMDANPLSLGTLGKVVSFLSGNVLTGVSWAGLTALRNTPVNLNGETIDGHPGGAPAYLTSYVSSSVAPVFHGLEVKHTSSDAGVTNHRAILSFADHLWIIDRPDQVREMWLRWNYPYMDPFIEPLTIYPSSGQAQNHSVLLMDENPYRIPQQEADTLYLRRRTYSIIDRNTPTAIVSAYPNSHDFSDIFCPNATAVIRVNSYGTDYIIVPYWGEIFNGSELFGVDFNTNQIVLVHKPRGTDSTYIHLFGEEMSGMPLATVGRMVDYGRIVADSYGVTLYDLNGSDVKMNISITNRSLPWLKVLLEN